MSDRIGIVIRGGEEVAAAASAIADTGLAKGDRLVATGRVTLVDYELDGLSPMVDVEVHDPRGDNRAEHIVSALELADLALEGAVSNAARLYVRAPA